MARPSGTLKSTTGRFQMIPDRHGEWLPAVVVVPMLIMLFWSNIRMVEAWSPISTITTTTTTTTTNPSSTAASSTTACTSRRMFWAHGWTAAATTVARVVPVVAIAGAVWTANNNNDNNGHLSSCWALDMDAFIQNELSNEVCDEGTNKKCLPKLTDDQALCRFGQPSKETGEACVRAGMSTKRPSGVDAFGKVDRGDYTRCKAKYVDDGKSNKLVKEWNCE